MNVLENNLSEQSSQKLQDGGFDNCSGDEILEGLSNSEYSKAEFDSVPDIKQTGGKGCTEEHILEGLDDTGYSPAEFDSVPNVQNGGSWNFITDPKTMKKHYIQSKTGQSILNNYLSLINN